MDWKEIASIVFPIIAFLGWMLNRIDKKFEEFRNEFRELRGEIKDVKIEVKELRTSLNRIEGAFYAKECCMIKDDSQVKKVE